MADPAIHPHSTGLRSEVEFESERDRETEDACDLLDRLGLDPKVYLPEY
jgi:hypothetical protein